MCTFWTHIIFLWISYIFLSILLTSLSSIQNCRWYILLIYPCVIPYNFLIFFVDSLIPFLIQNRHICTPSACRDSRVEISRALLKPLFHFRSCLLTLSAQNVIHKRLYYNWLLFIHKSLGISLTNLYFLYWTFVLITELVNVSKNRATIDCCLSVRFGQQSRNCLYWNIVQISDYWTD